MKGIFALCALLLVPAGLMAQANPHPLIGTWEAKANAEVRSVVIRPDSSASYGNETVRWRLVKDDQIAIALGGEWVTYKMKIRGNRLTLSGGDLTEPITLRRTGPAQPRPDSIPIPPDPDRS